MNLSQNTKEAIKTALAMTIAYGVGLYMNWDRPYWAGFAVAFISLDTMGQSMNKGAMRLAGTVLGAVVALTLVGLFAQHRWPFIFFASLWLGFCTYMNMGQRYQYAWFVAGFVSLIIAIDGGPDPANAFATAMLRMQQTGLGIAVYGVISALLWPKNSQAPLENTVLDLATNQQKLFQAGMNASRGSDDQALRQSLHTREVAALTSLGGHLDAALIDSDEIRANRQAWQEYCSLLNRLGMTLQRWQESFQDLQTLPMARLLPNLEGFALEIDARFTRLARLMQRQSNDASHEELTLDVDTLAARELPHFQRAALQLTHHQLREIDALTKKLLQAAHRIRTFAAPNEKPSSGTMPRPPTTLDPDRLVAAGKIMLGIWLAFLAPIYVGDFPGGIGFASACGALGMILISNQQIPVQSLTAPFAVGIAFASALYIFLMPQLSSFAGLGLMIFAATFSICYRYSAPQKALYKVICLAMFVMIISVSNQQSYNFLNVANTALSLGLVFLLFTVVSYIPFRPFPERRVMNLLKRYFHSAATLLAEQPPPPGAKIKRHISFHLREIENLPSKMQLWITHMDPAIVGEQAVQELPVILGKLHVLSYRLQALRDAWALPQAQQLLVLKNDMQSWRLKLNEALQRLAADPGDTRNLQRARLDQRLSELETRVADTLNASGTNELSDQQRENLYAILGSYRGVSEALLNLAESLDTIEWQPWYEERFA